MHKLLKILACGSVDDGKSTLIGHLMYNAGCLHADQKETLSRESAALYGETIDYSLLLDGLEAEREQRITIDVAYRFFSTEKRSFIIADAPGHSEYTRNMAVGASFADLALILLDAGKGVLPQTLRHYQICRLMGISDYVFVINKMDTVEYAEAQFESVKRAVEKMVSAKSEIRYSCIPVSATVGDNITQPSPNMPWFSGSTLLDCLENTVVDRSRESGFYMPVQRVGKPADGFPRGYQGCAECGSISVGDAVTVYPSGESSRVSLILNVGKQVQTAFQGQQITLSLEDEIDVSRGCVICTGFTPSLSTQFQAKLLWTDEEPPIDGKSYYMKLATSRVPVTLTLDKLNQPLSKNDFFTCTVCAASLVSIDRFEQHRGLGEFILIDRISHATAAWGKVILPLDNNYIYPIFSNVSSADHARQKGQTPVTLWFTGLPASGKTTIANEVEKRLYALGKHSFLLDGDSLRSGINAGLGFSSEARTENIRRTAHIARLMNDAGLITLVALVSPASADRKMAATVIGNPFYEIYVSTPPEVCEQRDTKGYYRKAREGKIKGFTGVSSNYQPPSAPHLILDTQNLDAAACAEQVISFLKSKKLL